MRVSHLALVGAFISLVLHIAMAINTYEVTRAARYELVSLRYGQERLDNELRACRETADASLAENERLQDWLKRIALASRVGWNEAHIVTMQLELE